MISSGKILGIGKYKDTEKVLPETLKEVENMERLVKEILTISKIEMDGLAGKAEPVSLPDTITKVTETLLPLVQERQITVHSQFTEDVTVSGNASLLEKAIHNILSNAMERLTAQMKRTQGITEQLKTENALEWTQRMNNIQACAKEIIEKEIIFA